jgi:hypothetical protein
MVIPKRPSALRRGDATVLLVASLLAGTAAGMLIYVLQTRLAHLLILFSLAMGAMVGLRVRVVVYRKRLRAPIAAALIAGLGGATAWAMPLAIGYAQYRFSVSDASPAESVTAWIGAELGAGTVFEKHTDRVTVGSLGTSIIWLVELLAAAGLAAELAYKAEPRAN